MGDNKISEAWPDYLMMRDTGLHDDAGGLGQHIFTTAGAGYEKVKYVRADLAHLQGEAVPVAWIDLTKLSRSKMVCASAYQIEPSQVPVFNYPQPAELSEVSGGSGELVKDALVRALKLARNRIQRLMLECPHGSSIRDDAGDWAGEATDAINIALAATGKQQVDPEWSLHDRVEFALRDAGFGLDEAFRLAALVDGKQQVGEVQGDGFLGYVRTKAIKALREDDEVTGVMVHTDELADSVPVYLASRQPEGHSVLQVGSKGTAYDPPNSHRAFTYTDQPGNEIAWRLGEAARLAVHAATGDCIDRGLLLLKGLQNSGFGVFQIGTTAAPPAQGIDLGQLKVEVQRLRKRTDPVLGEKAMYVRLDAVLALLDGRDAGTGVNNG